MTDCPDRARRRGPRPRTPRANGARFLVGIWPLPSFQLAFRLHNEVPGIIVPDCIQRQLADAGPDARKVGLEIARTLYLKARDDAAGVYVIPPFKEPQAALELLTD